MNANLEKQYATLVDSFARSKPINIHDTELMAALGASVDLSKPLRAMGGTREGRALERGELVTFTEAERATVMKYFKLGWLLPEADYQVSLTFRERKERFEKVKEAYRQAVNAVTIQTKATGKVERLRDDLTQAEGELETATANAARLEEELSEALSNGF